jgi:sorbitol/mannitol transport system permease protein
MSVAATGRTARRTTSNAPRPALRAAGDWARRAPLMPALVFMIIVTQLPFVATLIVSFLDWNALDPGSRRFTGVANYVAVAQDTGLRTSVLNTILLTVTVVFVSVVLGMVIALLLDRSFRGRGIVRTLMIAPFLVVPVAAALVWKHALYNPEYGLLNGLLTDIWRLFGSANPPQPDWITVAPRLAIDATLIWQWTPFMMLILLAGLQSRSSEAVEAARVDGASAWQAFRFLTMPHMRQYIELGALLGSIYIVQTFDAVYTLTAGGLGTANLPYTIYQTFFAAQDYGQASAAGVVVVFGSILIATFALRVVSSLFKQEVTR